MKHAHFFKLAAVLFGLVALVGTAHAQVAAPRLNDVKSNTLDPFNAAVLPWHETTIVGLDVINNLTMEGDFGGSTLELGTGDGNALYLRAVGQSFAFAADTSTINLDLNPTFWPPAGQTLEIKNSNLAIAAKLGDSFTVSVSMEGSEETETDNATSLSSSTKGSAPTFGGTWKISNAFYLGGTYSKATVDLEGGGGSASGERTIGRFGAGFYQRSDTSGFHVEVYREDAGLLEVRDAANLLVYAEQGETTGITLEFMGGNFLFGFESIKTTTDTLQPPAPLNTQEEQARTISLGYTPKTGFAISLSKLDVEQTETQNPGGTINFGAMVLGLAWKF